MTAAATPSDGGRGDAEQREACSDPEGRSWPGRVRGRYGPPGGGRAARDGGGSGGGSGAHGGKFGCRDPGWGTAQGVMDESKGADGGNATLSAGGRAERDTGGLGSTDVREAEGAGGAACEREKP